MTWPHLCTALARWFCLPLALALALAAAGCGGDGGGRTAQELTEEGWSLFQAGDYAGAGDRFAQALAQDAGYADAANGQGWARLEQRAYDGAAQSLSLALSLAGGATQIGSEARAGLAAAQHAGGSLDEATQVAEALIAADPDFVFSRRPSVDVRDVRLTLAGALIGLGAGETDTVAVDSLLDRAAVQVNLLDPVRPLERSNPATWCVPVQDPPICYDTFAAALTEKLEWLVQLYWG